jgi:hypothetical protein
MPPPAPPRFLDLGYQPRDWQRECHMARKRFTVLAVHRKGGKTELALMELIDGAMKSRLKLPRFVYIAPWLVQAKAVAWSRLKAILQPLIVHGGVDFNEAELTARFLHNGATIRLFGADNPNALRGIDIDGAVLDEVAQIGVEVWFDIIEPNLASRLGWALFIGTPFGINLFSQMFQFAQGNPDWHAARYTVYDTHAIPEAEVQRLQAADNPSRFAREFLCDFTAAGDDQLISLVDVEAAAHRVYTERDVLAASKVVGVDVARFGDDRSVIVRRHGLHMFPPVVLRGADNMEMATRCRCHQRVGARRRVRGRRRRRRDHRPASATALHLDRGAVRVARAQAARVHQPAHRDVVADAPVAAKRRLNPR